MLGEPSVIAADMAIDATRPYDDGNIFGRRVFDAVQRAAGRAGGGIPGGVRDAGAASHRLDAPMVSASAQRASGLNHDMPDLAGDPMGARVELTPKQEPGADAGRDGDIDQLAGTTAGAATMLTERSQVRIVMKKARNAGCVGEDAVERHVAKAWQVGRADDKTGGWINRSRQADAQRPDPGGRAALLAQRLRDRRHDSVDDVLTAAGSFGGLPDHRPQPAAIIRRGDPQLGATEVDADQPHQRQRGRGKGRSVRPASRAPTNSAIAVARKMR